MKMKSEAKKEALKKMKEGYKSERMKDMMGDMEDMKKVTVMSDSEEGLKEGLSKAEQIMKMKEGGKKYKDGGKKKSLAERINFGGKYSDKK